MTCNKEGVLRKFAIVWLLSMVLFGVIAAQEKQTFNVKVEIPETYSETMAGENIWYGIKFLNLANQDRIDVIIKSEILDLGGNLVASSSETVAVETQASFISKLNIPADTPKGDYKLKVTVISTSGDSEAQADFKVITALTNVWNVIKHSLFDISIEIPNDYKKINPGNELLANIKLVNIGSAGRVDVFLDYEIKNAKNETILEKRETVAVETQANFVRMFDIPKSASLGQYKLFAKIIYADGKEAAAEQSFEVIGNYNYKWIMFAIGALVVIGIIVLLARKAEGIAEKIKIKMKVHGVVKARLDSKK